KRAVHLQDSGRAFARDVPCTWACPAVHLHATFRALGRYAWSEARSEGEEAWRSGPARDRRVQGPAARAIAPRVPCTWVCTRPAGTWVCTRPAAPCNCTERSVHLALRRARRSASAADPRRR